MYKYRDEYETVMMYIKKSRSNKRKIYQRENNSEKHLGLPPSEKDKNYLEKELSMFPLTARSLTEHYGNY